MKGRFASAGKFTVDQLEAGEDLQAAEAAAAAAPPEFDPDDKRSLYERLKAQQDAKQEEFEHRNAFKNQMDHWRLDEDDAAFEEERMAKQRQQQQDAARLHEEGAQFYKLARAAQERVARQPSAALPTASTWQARGHAEKRKLPTTKLAPVVKVVRRAEAGDASVGSSASPTALASTSAGSAVGGMTVGAAKTASGGGLPGMDMYSDDDDDDDGS
jgi:hypothetical protein